MTHPRSLSLAALLVLAAVAAAPARAEVFAQPDASGGAMVIVAPAGADGSFAWTPRGLASDPSLVLNPGGDAFGDGQPVFAYDPMTGVPHVAWAARNRQGGERYIRAARFDGRSWVDLGAVRRERGRDDASPALMIVDGDPFIAWVDLAGESSVWYSRAQGGLWQTPVQASPVAGAWRGPSLALTASDIVLGFASANRLPAPPVMLVLIPRYTVYSPQGTDGPMPIPPGYGSPPGGGKAPGGPRPQ